MRPPRRPTAAPSSGPVRRRPLPPERLIWGQHAAQAAWLNPDRVIQQALLMERATLPPPPAGLTRPQPVPVIREEIESILPEQSVHQGVALVVEPLPERDLTEVLLPPGLLLALDQVTDPQNLGAILRSAAAFGVRAVIVPDRHSPPLTGTVARIAVGAVEQVPLVRVANLSRALEDAKRNGYWITGLAEQASQPIQAQDLQEPLMLVLGAEDHGLRRLVAETCDHLVKISTAPGFPSLNVAQATAVALHEVARRRRPGP